VKQRKQGRNKLKNVEDFLKNVKQIYRNAYILLKLILSKVDNEVHKNILFIVFEKFKRLPILVTA
jgi:F0F1-type ATP synthase delta subunit